MKLANYISICGIALCMLSACESDLDKTIYNKEDIKPAVLQEIAPSYTLEAEKANETAVTMEWSKPDVGYKAAVTNSLEMGLAGKEFGTTSILSSTSDKYKTEITVVDLNKAVLKLLNNVIPAEPVEVEFRISSGISNATAPFTSNVVKAQITPYSMEKEYPFIALRGDYNGWSWDNSQKVYSKDEKNDYAAMIFFGQDKAANGWKFCGAEDWSVDNWGYTAGDAEAAMMTLSQSGGDMKSYSQTTYYVEFNNETGALKMSKGHNSWGIYKEGASSDIEFSLSDDAITSLTATIELKAGDKWRIRPDNNDLDAIAPTDVEHSLVVDGNYFQAEEDGTYLVTWNFNKVTPQLMIKKKQ